MSGGVKHKLYFSTRCRFCQAFMEELIRTPFVREVSAICVDPSPSRPPLPPWLKSVPALLVFGEHEPRIGPGPVNNWLAERRIGSGAPGASGSFSSSPSSAFDDRRTPLAAPVYNPDMSPRAEATSRMAVGGAGTTIPPSRSIATGPMPSKLPAAISANTEANSSMAPPVLAGSELVGEKGPEAYHETEMSGGSWSDNYSFLGEVGYTAEKGYDPIMRNFKSLYDEDAGAAATSARGSGYGGVAGGAASGGGAASAAATGKPASAKEAALLRDYEAYAASRDRDVMPPPQRR